MGKLFLLARAVTYGVLFVGLLLVYLPSQVLAPAGVAGSGAGDGQKTAGELIAAAGAGIAVWCIACFVVVGDGTQAPFDPPRRLVGAGPYRFVRNPMYTGAGLVLGGAALFYASLPLLAYVALFMLVAHLFVLLYEEPTLRRSFGEDYAAYCRKVGRWWPILRGSGSSDSARNLP